MLPRAGLDDGGGAGTSLVSPRIDGSGISGGKGFSKSCSVKAHSYFLTDDLKNTVFSLILINLTLLSLGPGIHEG